MRPRPLAAALRHFAHLASNVGHPVVHSRSTATVYDQRIRHELSTRHARCTPLPTLLKQLETRSARVLKHTVPYESTPNLTRRIAFDAAHDGVVTVSHAVDDGAHGVEVHSCSGFAISVPGTDTTTILTCAHTLQEVKHSPLLTAANARSATFVTTRGGSVIPVSEILSSLPWNDLLLLALDDDSAVLPTLPISPYPAQSGTATQLPIVVTEPSSSWMNAAWTAGSVYGYRGPSGRPAEPGTYDALSQVLFSPCPTQGTSGAPLVDGGSGAVIGVALGTKVELGELIGFGVPSEVIYEMFDLPGMHKP